MFGFSLRLYISQAAVAIHNQLEKLLLSSFVGVAAAGWYDIASDVALKLRGLIGLVLGPVLPAASELDARNDQQRLAELYYRAQKYLAFVGVPVVCYVSVISGWFVRLWLGPKLAFIALPLVVLLWVNFCNLCSGPGFLIFAGRGYLKPGMQSALLGIVLNVALSVGLIYKFGFAGAVLGTSLALTLASTFFFYLFHDRTGYSVGHLLHEAYLKPLISAIGIAILLWLALHEMVPSWASLILLGAAFGAFYVAAMLSSRFFDQYDWGKLESLIPSARHFRRIIPIA